jgi:FkbM family methyltransferase
MLIPFHDIIQKYGRPKGVIHIGAHLLEERKDYISASLYNTIWIEANLELYKIINKQISSTETVINYAVSDVSNQTATLYCTNNSQSSSILPLGLHQTYYPHITISHTQNIITQRMDDIISKYSIDLENYNFINVDIQGVELKALRGFGDLLLQIDFIYTEVNREYLYENCDLINDIDDYLGNLNFVREQTVWTDSGWGDAIYVKR